MMSSKHLQLIIEIKSEHRQHSTLKVLSTEYLQLIEKLNSEYQLHPGLRVLTNKHFQLIEELILVSSNVGEETQ